MERNDKPMSRWWKKSFTGTVITMLFLLLFTAGASSTRSGRLDEFARCLTEKKAIMYGSFLCPHCQDQKELFGNSWPYIQYVECSVPGSRRIAPACAAAKIQHVPTWVFGDGQRREGLVQLQELSQRTGCKLP